MILHQNLKVSFTHCNILYKIACIQIFLVSFAKSSLLLLATKLTSFFFFFEWVFFRLERAEKKTKKNKKKRKSHVDFDSWLHQRMLQNSHN